MIVDQFGYYNECHMGEQAVWDSPDYWKEDRQVVSLTDLVAFADEGDPYEWTDGIEVRRIRQDAGVTSTELAAAAGISDRTLRGVESSSRPNFGSRAVRLRIGRILTHLRALEGRS